MNEQPQNLLDFVDDDDDESESRGVDNIQHNIYSPVKCVLYEVECSQLNIDE